ncbi:ABC transporter permease [Acanthopleuribacter pedis]|uniref:ABC transporter permease n=1 Tax=Acanthopleuribacter pedis TaxID=442870 RepID=A0A8J7QJR4_9BACT|nr:ABC transporter permease [Acanthopleuribacter pedis]MBO1319493.1 ABC transporter permease [Acanthopleuribacter pedis]
MIGTILKLNWLTLKRDPVALALSFIMPLIFFTIFAVIFGGGGGSNGGMNPINVLVVAEPTDAFAEKFVTKLAEQPSLTITRFENLDPVPQGDPETVAHQQVRAGTYDAALMLPSPLEQSVGNFGVGGGDKAVLVYDAANPVARFALAGLIQANVMQTAPDIMLNRGMSMFGDQGAPLTPQQQQLVDEARDFLNAEGAPASTGAGGTAELLPLDARDARDSGETGEEKQSPSTVAYYAAGIGIMFLLFSMTAAGGSILEEEESGTLDRLLSSQLGINQLMLGKWLFYTISGGLQLTVMFVYGALVFAIPLFTVKTMTAFLLMTTVSAMGAAAFGMFLATVSKSRAQLSGLSTVVILIMSAVGGSMVPRFIMPPAMATAGKFTFNGWAIDGYLKIFWRADPNHNLAEALLHIAPELAVIALMAALMLGGAIFSAQRRQAA